MSGIVWVPTDSIRPAEYNPRRIGEDDFKALCKSVGRLGIIVPIIVNRSNGVIIAGHQRQKAARAIGMERVPVMYAHDVSPSDEVLFNQIHNGTDFDKGLTARIAPQEREGYIEVPPEQNTAVCERRTVVNEAAKLLVKYGNVLSCVSTHDGEVFKAPAYAEACRVLNISANVYVVPSELEAFAKRAFQGSYGVFTYDHLKKNTWVQGLAQLSRRMTNERVDGTDSKRTAQSRLYERLVIPSIDRGMRVIDFGAGKGQYAARLRGMGYHVDSIEFYHNNRKGINVSAGNRDITNLVRELRTGGLYDAVVLDSVLNSVDSQEAERSVVGTCSALLKVGGRLFMSGRPRSAVETKLRLGKSASRAREMYFLDDEGLSASFRKGNFYYQKFHTDEQVRTLAEAHGFRIVEYDNDGNGWRCTCVKEKHSPHCESGVRFEFTLPYPGGRYDRDAEVLEAIAEARSR